MERNDDIFEKQLFDLTSDILENLDDYIKLKKLPKDQIIVPILTVAFSTLYGKTYMNLMDSQLRTIETKIGQKVVDLILAISYISKDLNNLTKQNEIELDATLVNMINKILVNEFSQFFQDQNEKKAMCEYVDAQLWQSLLRFGEKDSPLLILMPFLTPKKQTKGGSFTGMLVPFASKVYNLFNQPTYVPPVQTTAANTLVTAPEDTNSAQIQTYDAPGFSYNPDYNVQVQPMFWSAIPYDNNTNVSSTNIFTTQTSTNQPQLEPMETSTAETIISTLEQLPEWIKSWPKEKINEWKHAQEVWRQAFIEQTQNDFNAVKADLDAADVSMKQFGDMIRDQNVSESTISKLIHDNVTQHFEEYLKNPEQLHRDMKMEISQVLEDIKTFAQENQMDYTATFNSMESLLNMIGIGIDVAGVGAIVVGAFVPGIRWAAIGAGVGALLGGSGLIYGNYQASNFRTNIANIADSYQLPPEQLQSWNTTYETLTKKLGEDINMKTVNAWYQKQILSIDQNLNRLPNDIQKDVMKIVNSYTGPPLDMVSFVKTTADNFQTRMMNTLMKASPLGSFTDAKSGRVIPLMREIIDQYKSQTKDAHLSPYFARDVYDLLRGGWEASHILSDAKDQLENVFTLQTNFSQQLQQLVEKNDPDETFRTGYFSKLGKLMSNTNKQIRDSINNANRILKLKGTNDTIKADDYMFTVNEDTKTIQPPKQFMKGLSNETVRNITSGYAQAYLQQDHQAAPERTHEYASEHVIDDSFLNFARSYAKVWSHGSNDNAFEKFISTAHVTSSADLIIKVIAGLCAPVAMVTSLSNLLRGTAGDVKDLNNKTEPSKAMAFATAIGLYKGYLGPTVGALAAAAGVSPAASAMISTATSFYFAYAGLLRSVAWHGVRFLKKMAWPPIWRWVQNRFNISEEQAKTIEETSSAVFDTGKNVLQDVLSNITGMMQLPGQLGTTAAQVVLPKTVAKHITPITQALTPASFKTHYHEIKPFSEKVLKHLVPLNREQKLPKEEEEKKKEIMEPPVQSVKPRMIPASKKELKTTKIQARKPKNKKNETKLKKQQAVQKYFKPKQKSRTSTTQPKKKTAKPKKRKTSGPHLVVAKKRKT